jgi:hypothetical protein
LSGTFAPSIVALGLTHALTPSTYLPAWLTVTLLWIAALFSLSHAEHPALKSVNSQKVQPIDAQARRGRHPRQALVSPSPYGSGAQPV